MCRSKSFHKINIACHTFMKQSAETCKLMLSIIITCGFYESLTEEQLTMINTSGFQGGRGRKTNIE